VVADAIAEVNRLMCADSADGMFVTLFYAHLEPVSGVLTYLNAGHNPPLFCRAGDQGGAEVLEEPRPTGMALGINGIFSMHKSAGIAWASCFALARRRLTLRARAPTATSRASKRAWWDWRRLADALRTLGSEVLPSASSWIDRQHLYTIATRSPLTNAQSGI
jgi:hypothetical protein